LRPNQIVCQFIDNVPSVLIVTEEALFKESHTGLEGCNFVMLFLGLAIGFKEDI